MSARLTLATAGRILRQLAHDKRTVAIVIVVPIVVISMLHYALDADQQVIWRVDLIMVGVFPIILMFLVGATMMVRERTSGTLERLMTTPIGKGDVMVGYALAFGLVAAVQVAVTAAYTFGVLGLQVAGSAWLVLATSVVAAQLGVAFGLLAAAVSTSEFQAVQLFPAVIITQLLLCGLFGPRDGLVPVLRYLSDVMPISYAVQALTELSAAAEPTGLYWMSLAVTAGCVVVLLAIASATLRRRTP